MNYPVWYLPDTGGGLLIALIAILHVFVSHFAVGGGLYLIYAEKKGLREKSEAILQFTRYHARFFLLVTMVFGSITGVGIWFIIALVNPGATSILIHNFVFGWAAEWVFFVVEIVAAFVYYYMFGRMDSATHVKMGWVYFIAAWMSLFLINGIIGFMLTPGGWLENRNFWVGFFNPSFFPSLFFRTFIAIMIAACYGYFTASFSADDGVRVTMTRFSAKMGLAGLVAAVPAGIWYILVLPDQAQGLVLGKSPTISLLLPYGAVGLVALAIIMLWAGIIRPAWNQKATACVAMVAALAVMGSFEWVREAARRPYVINEVMYSNAILKDEVDDINAAGFLRSAIWVSNKELAGDNIVAAGEEIFINQCYACHTVAGSNNGIYRATANMSYRALKNYIGRIHEIRYFMPPFAGTKEEAAALAAYIAGGLHGKEIIEAGTAEGSGPKGKPVFEEHCSSCHMVEDVQDYFADRSREDIAAVLGALNEISSEMEPFAGSEDEKGSLADYLYQLHHPEAAPEGAAQNGSLLFEDNCSACHQLEDVGPAFAGMDQAEAIEMLRTLDRISDEMQPFSGTEDEAGQLASYLGAEVENPEAPTKGGN
jgi:mono/diheme cytochrome c family protein